VLLAVIRGARMPVRLNGLMTPKLPRTATVVLLACAV